MIMDFNVKLQQLRNQKGLTQEQLAEKVFVSRVAVAKWESGRGYPNLESLKKLAKVFEVSIDELLSSEELIDLAKVHTEQKFRIFRTLIFGILDFLAMLTLIIPMFANRNSGKIEIVNLLKLLNQEDTPIYIKITFITLIFSSTLFGAIELIFQNIQDKWKQKLELVLSGILSCFCIIIFIVTNQQYPCIFFFTLFVIKVVFTFVTEK